MDEVVRGMYQPLADSFDAYNVTDEGLLAKINDWKARFTAFAEGCADVSAYAATYYTSDLNTEYTDLITKAAMSSMGLANADGSVKNMDELNENKAGIISVKEFVEQYRINYDLLKKVPYRTRGAKAYEDVFAVADRTDDMLEAQTIMEKERLLYKLITEDAIQTLEITLEAIDPLQENLSGLTRHLLDIYKKSVGEEETIYKSLLPVLQQAQLQQYYASLMQIVLLIAYWTNNYSVWKMLIWSWSNDADAKEAITQVILHRRMLQKLMAYLKEYYNMTLADIINTEWLKIWLLNPVQGVGGIGLIRGADTVKKFDVLKDIIENEILSDTSTEDIILRKPPIIYRTHTQEEEKAFNAWFTKKSEEHLSKFKYFSDMEAVMQAAKSFMPGGTS